MIHKPPYNFQRSPKYVQKVGLKFWNRAGPSRNWTRDLWLCSQMLYHYTTELYMASWRKLRDMKFLVHHCLRKNNILILCQFMIHKPPYNFQSSPKYDEKVGLKFWKRAAPSRTRSRVPWLGSQTLYHYTKELWMTILRKLKDMKFLVHHSFKFAKKQYFFFEEM